MTRATAGIRTADFRSCSKIAFGKCWPRFRSFNAPASVLVFLRSVRGRLHIYFVHPTILEEFSLCSLRVLLLYFGSYLGFLFLVGFFGIFEYVDQVLAL